MLFLFVHNIQECLLALMRGGLEKCIPVDKWCEQVNQHITKSTIPEEFMCHVCKWKSWKPIAKQNHTSCLYDCDIDLKCLGHLYFPEFGLIVEPPFEDEIHAQGGTKCGKNGEKGQGSWHGVVDISMVKRIQELMELGKVTFDGFSVTALQLFKLSGTEIEDTHPSITKLNVK